MVNQITGIRNMQIPKHSMSRNIVIHKSTGSLIHDDLLENTTSEAFASDVQIQKKPGSLVLFWASALPLASPQTQFLRGLRLLL